MASVESAGKFCTACGEDVSGKPRTKDARGRYFCKSCYAAAAERSRASVPPTAPSRRPPPVPVATSDDDDLLAGLSGGAALASPGGAMQACPGCGGGVAADAVLCTGCGFDFRTGKKTQMKISQETVEKRARSRSSFGAGAASNPLVVWGVLLAVIAVAVFVSMGSADVRFGTLIAIRAFSFVIGIWILIAAFREDTMTGLFTLCIPFFALYFVYFKNDDSHLKAATAVSLLATVGLVVLLTVEAGNG